MSEQRRSAEFERLLDPVLDTAYRVALRLAKDRDDAADLVQEAILSAFRHFESFEPGTNFRAWFLTILTRHYFRIRKKERPEKEAMDISETPEVTLFTHAKENGLLDSSADPAGALVDSLAIERVNVALEQLPVEFRVTATLYLLENLTYEEIAGIVGSPIGTVRSRIHRARNLLQRYLMPFILEMESSGSAKL